MALAQPEIKLSPTVKRARDRLADYDSIFALDIVREILGLHRNDYAPEIDRDSLVDSKNSDRKHVDDWLKKVRLQFDQDATPELHGRIVILGLGLLNGELNRQLDELGFSESLKKDLNTSFTSLLTTSGLDYFYQQSSETAIPSDDEKPEIESGERSIDETPQSRPEAVSVRVVPDDALHNVEHDQLGRAAYAKYLAKRLMAISAENRDNEQQSKESGSSNAQRAFAIHLYGPWGSGKSTVMNFLRSELENNQWLVVEFNAWRNQNVKPPWWTLMEFVFKKSKSKNLSPWGRFAEYWWRLRLGYASYSLYLFISACLLGIGFWVYGATIFSRLDEWKDAAKNISVTVSALVGAWAAVNGISQSVLSNSEQGVEGFIKSSSNPMEKIAEKFAGLIGRIEHHGRAKRVAIFIDDLDRCEADYVVELLEGFQTLFRKKSVFFVVAADQHWLNACFEEIYSKLQPHVKEPGKPLGTLFLEKVFQFSVPMPGIPDHLRKAYWSQHLLNIKNKEEHLEKRQKLEDEIKLIVQNVDTDTKYDDVLRAGAERKSLGQQLLRQLLVIQSAAQEFSKNIEAHTLSKFARLLEPNPRSMKRLVNAFSVNRTLSTLSELDIDKDIIALWTILETRWPELAEHLRSEPDDFKYILENDNLDDDSFLGELLNLEGAKILAVVNGEGVKGLNQSLSINLIQDCAKLRM